MEPDIFSQLIQKVEKFFVGDQIRCDFSKNKTSKYSYAFELCVIINCKQRKCLLIGMLLNHDAGGRI